MIEKFLVIYNNFISLHLLKHTNIHTSGIGGDILGQKPGSGLPAEIENTAESPPHVLRDSHLVTQCNHTYIHAFAHITVGTYIKLCYGFKTLLFFLLNQKSLRKFLHLYFHGLYGNSETALVNYHYLTDKYKMSQKYGHDMTATPFQLIGGLSSQRTP